jgi:hypothetical protein
LRGGAIVMIFVVKRQTRTPLPNPEQAMRKLGLNLDALPVRSLAAGRPEDSRGTVRADEAVLAGNVYGCANPFICPLCHPSERC